MAVIDVLHDDNNPLAARWSMPPSPQALRSPVPLGTVSFEGTFAIATLVAGNETSVRLNLIMPSGFVYLIRHLAVRFTSDDTDLTFDAAARGFYSRAGHGVIGLDFNLSSPASSDAFAVSATRIWTPDQGTPKVLLKAADSMGLRFQDMDAAQDGATAGDFFYSSEFYVFPFDQADKWEVNTPIPVINHAAF